jgi:hypothetical protein
MNMRPIKKLAAMSAAMGLLAAQPAQACWTDSEAQAASVANLNMMMMVTALRCRKGPDNFLAEYNRFVTGNNAALGAQNAVIKARFARLNGVKASEGAMDRFTIGLANHYGTGHGEMGCKELKNLASELAAKKRDSASLIGIAELKAGLPTLPGGTCGTRVAAR